MSWQANLGGQLTVFSEGEELPPPENKSVAVLFVGLLARGSNWTSRDELSRLLYPDSESLARRSSLRQSMLRLRRWLGAQALEERKDLVRLSEGEWTYSLLLQDGNRAPGPMIAPGLVHPWIESIRLEWSPVVRSEHDDRVSHFAMAVETAARIDPDTGRSLLVGGALLTDSLSVDQFGTLLGLTQPKDRRDPLAFEHLGLRSSLYFRLGFHRESKEGFKSAYRLAIQQRRPAQIISAGAMVLFLEIEDGQLGEAAAWVDYLQNARNADTKSLLFCNAKAAYLWNMNRLDDAVSQMRLAIRRVPSEDRATRLHFWTNFAVLCAEANELESCQDALAEARSLGIPGLDIFKLVTLDLGEATYLMAVKRTDEAIALLEGSQAICAQRGHEPADWYAVEAKAEALAIAGRLTEAKRLWSQVQATRLSRCTRLTPRLMARRARIMRSG